MGTNRNLSAKPGSKNAREFFEGWLLSRIFEEFQHPTIQTKIVQHYGGFISSK
jgi:hypothetical protein